MTGVLKTKLLPLLLAALMIMSCLPLTAFAVDEETGDPLLEDQDGDLLYITESEENEPPTAEDVQIPEDEQITEDDQVPEDGSDSAPSDVPDENGDDERADRGYMTPCFSVTVPANLTIVLAPDGSVSTATNAEITNNSTDPVKVAAVSVITANGWTLVPFSTNMADEKVDSKQIGFSINDAVSTLSGNAEDLFVGYGWQIERNSSLPIEYDAVVSAVSVPVSEQVLTVVFVLEWVPLLK